MEHTRKQRARKGELCFRATSPTNGPDYEITGVETRREGKNSEASNEKVDVESGMNEVAGGSSKAKPLRHVWR